MKIIPLSNGYSTRVDDEDYEYLSNYNWLYSRGYAVRVEIIDNKRVSIFMHRIIMETPDNLDCDHKDGDGLNNQKFNLRNCTRQQNIWNKGKHKNSSSKYKGVSLHQGKWLVHIKNPITNKIEHIGVYENELNAARRYNEVATMYFGEFARLNPV